MKVSTRSIQLKIAELDASPSPKSSMRTTYVPGFLIIVCDGCLTIVELLASMSVSDDSAMVRLGSADADTKAIVKTVAKVRERIVLQYSVRRQ